MCIVLLASQVSLLWRGFAECCISHVDQRRKARGRRYSHVERDCLSMRKSCLGGGSDSISRSWLWPGGRLSPLWHADMRLECVLSTIGNITDEDFLALLELALASPGEYELPSLCTVISRVGETYYTSDLSSVADTFYTLASRLTALSAVISDPATYEAASDPQLLDSDTRSMLHQLCIQPSAQTIGCETSTDCLSQHFGKASSRNKRHCWHQSASSGGSSTSLSMLWRFFILGPFFLASFALNARDLFELINMLVSSLHQSTSSDNLICTIYGWSTQQRKLKIPTAPADPAHFFRFKARSSAGSSSPLVLPIRPVNCCQVIWRPCW
jgi:hypothetical protein